MGAAPLTLYYRNGCHLCEELASVLYRGWPEQAEMIEWRDVDSSADWRKRYGARVPVLMRGEHLICELRADPDGLADYFGKPVNPL